MGRSGVAFTKSWNFHHASPILRVPSGSRCWLRRRAKAFGVFADESKSDEATPVLAEQGDVPQVERVEQQTPQPSHMPGIGVVVIVHRFVGSTEPDEIRCDNPNALEVMSATADA